MTPSLRLSLLGVLLFVSCTGGGNGLRPGSGNPGGGVMPPSGGSSATLSPGLLSAVAGDGLVRLDWALPEEGFEAALFRASKRALVYTGTPLSQDLQADHVVLSGLANGSPLFFGVAARETGTSAWIPTGAVLEALPGPVIFVDLDADPSVQDGLSPSTAFPRIFLGLLTAFASGGGNVWIRGGTYEESFLPVGALVHLYGGFAPGFDLEERDAAASGTTVLVDAGATGFSIQSGPDGAILDSIGIDGSAGGRIGLDLLDSAAQLRRIDVLSFSDRGMRFRNQAPDCFDILLLECSAVGNGADGVSSSGPFDLTIERSSFRSNTQEGIEMCDLLALANSKATLRIRDSEFLGNGTEGIDVDLAAPLFPGLGTGSFLVSVRNSTFASNGADGLLLDEDYELTPGWFADIEIVGCSARDNRGAGFHVDADGPGSIFFHHLRSSANAGDGILVTSELDTGFALVSDCLLEGNLGAGLRATAGSKSLVVTQSVLSGNAAGGLLSDFVRSTITNSVSYLEAMPWRGASVFSGTAVGDALAPNFELAPEGFTSVVAISGTSLTLAGADVLFPAAICELADDGMPRLVTSASGTRAGLEEAPAGLFLPTPVAVFAPGSKSVDSDYRLVPGSVAEGLGLSAPGDPSPDAGLQTSAGAGPIGTLGGTEIVPLRPTSVSPPSGTPLAPTGDIVFSFSSTIDPSSLTTDRVRVLPDQGPALSITTLADQNRVTISPPSGGWGLLPLHVELHLGIRAADGTELIGPLVFLFQPAP